jgi:hypothetical protein
LSEGHSLRTVWLAHLAAEVRAVLYHTSFLLLVVSRTSSKPPIHFWGNSAVSPLV